MSNVFGWQGSIHGVCPVRAFVFIPVGRKFALIIRQRGQFHMFALIQSRTVFGNHCVCFFGFQGAFTHEFFGIQSTRTRVCVDFAIHHRLREHGVIALVVSEFAEAHNVNHHIFFELFAIIQGCLNAIAHGFWVVPIHMENRCVNHFGNVGAI